MIHMAGNSATGPGQFLRQKDTVTAMHDYVVGTVLLGLAGFILSEASRFPPPPPHAMASSATFPQIIAVLIVFFVVLLIIRTVRARSKEVQTQGLPLSSRGVIGILSTVVYLFVLRPVGFVVSTTAILTLYSILLQNERLRFLDSVVVPLIMVAVVYFMLVLLRVSVPTGILF